MATSSSGTKPCAHHTSAVVAAAFATCGRANVAAAATLNVPRITERLVRFLMLVTFLFMSRLLLQGVCRPSCYYRAILSHLKWLSPPAPFGGSLDRCSVLNAALSPERSGISQR